MATSNLTVRQKSRHTGMRWRRLGIVAGLICAAASMKLVASPSVRRPVAKFIYFYQQTDDMNLLERVVYGLLKTNSTEPSS
jgi:hypothetical protein